MKPFTSICSRLFAVVLSLSLLAVFAISFTVLPVKALPVCSDFDAKAASDDKALSYFRQQGEIFHPARVLKNGFKIDRLPLAFSTLQLNNFQYCEVGNPRDPAIKQPRVSQTVKTKKGSPEGEPGICL